MLLYKCDKGACDDGRPDRPARLLRLVPEQPDLQLPGGDHRGAGLVRFDDMKWPMAAMVWNRVLPLQTLDTAAIIEFDQTFGERTKPGKLSRQPEPQPTAPASRPGRVVACRQRGAGRRRSSIRGPECPGVRHAELGPERLPGRLAQRQLARRAPLRDRDRFGDDRFGVLVAGRLLTGAALEKRGPRAVAEHAPGIQFAIEFEAIGRAASGARRGGR